MSPNDYLVLTPDSLQQAPFASVAQLPDFASAEQQPPTLDSLAQQLPAFASTEQHPPALSDLDADTSCVAPLISQQLPSLAQQAQSQLTQLQTRVSQQQVPSGQQASLHTHASLLTCRCAFHDAAMPPPTRIAKTANVPTNHWIFAIFIFCFPKFKTIS
ncbi:MAG: hypothetical protein KGQ60_06395 [Planctomycetes bacterium]|nr:hypothetical protein [Planctomycetota bacterium]